MEAVRIAVGVVDHIAEAVHIDVAVVVGPIDRVVVDMVAVDVKPVHMAVG
jgi:hypothetical protein